MANTIDPPPGFESLSAEEQVAYVQALWDLIAERPDAVPVPEWHRAVIAERLAEARALETPTRRWSEVRAELRDRLRDARR